MVAVVEVVAAVVVVVSVSILDLGSQQMEGHW